MTKLTGLGDALYVDGFDLSGGIQALGQVGGGPAALDLTTIRQLAMDRKGGIRDGRLETTSFVDADAASAFDVFSAMTLNDEILTYCFGEGIGSPAACLTAKQANYDGSRDTSGNLVFSTSAQATAGTGLEWTLQNTVFGRTDTAATNGASLDWTAGTNFGLQAYLQVVSFSGTDATVKIQQSSDNGAGDAWADVTGGAFTAVTTGQAPLARRLQTTRALAIERYLRVVTTTSAGFTSMKFLVAIRKNRSEVLF